MLNIIKGLEPWMLWKLRFSAKKCLKEIDSYVLPGKPEQIANCFFFNKKEYSMVMKVCTFDGSLLKHSGVHLSWPTSGSEFCAVLLQKMPASGWRLLWESSSFVPWFVPSAFRDISGAVPVWPSTSGFMRKTSSRASAPSMRFSVLLNSCDNFSVTLPSISSETWVM